MASPTAQISRTSRFDMRGRRLANLPTDALGRPINNTNANAYTQSGYRTGVMNQTDGQNAGFAAQPWAPSSGAGPGTRGYRGSFDGGYGSGYGHYRGASRSGSGEEGFKTKRPTASTSDEYYANRDAVIGNPLTMLKMNGPGRFNILDRVRAESQGGMKMRTNADGSVSGMSDLGEGAASPSPSSAMGRTEYSDGNHNTIADANGSRLFSRWGTGKSWSGFRPPSAKGDGEDFEAVTQESRPEIGFEPVKAPITVRPSVLEKARRQGRQAQMSKMDADMAGGTFSPGGVNVSRVEQSAGAVGDFVGRNVIDPIKYDAKVLDDKANSVWNYFFGRRFVPQK